MRIFTNIIIIYHWSWSTGCFDIRTQIIINDINRRLADGDRRVFLWISSSNVHRILSVGSFLYIFNVVTWCRRWRYISYVLTRYPSTSFFISIFMRWHGWHESLKANCMKMGRGAFAIPSMCCFGPQQQVFTTLAREMIQKVAIVWIQLVFHYVID